MGTKVNNAASAIQNTNSHNNGVQNKYTPKPTYTIKKGDTLSQIAQKVGQDIPTIMKNNPNIKSPNKIYVGEKINLGSPQQSGNYTVKKGDTLSEIAKKNNTTVGEIIRANPKQITNQNLIYPGQKLNIPKPLPKEVGTQTKPTPRPLPRVETTTPKPTPRVDVPKPTTPTTTDNVANKDVKLSQNIKLKSNNISLSPLTKQRMSQIADEYNRLTGKKLTITDGNRTPKDQAERIYDKIREGKADGLYKDKVLLAEIKTAYNQGVSKGESREQVTNRMAKVIQDQANQGKYISKHLVGEGADVRISDMTAADRKAFQQAVSKVGGAKILNEGNHWHIEVTGKSNPLPTTKVETPKVVEPKPITPAPTTLNSDNKKLLEQINSLNPPPKGPNRKVSKKTGKVIDPGGVGSAENQAKTQAAKYLTPEIKARFEKIAKETGLPPALLAGIASRESGFGAYLVGKKGGNLYGWGDPQPEGYRGFGIMQIDRKTGGTDYAKKLDAGYGKKQFDPYSEENIRAGAEVFMKKLNAVEKAYPNLSKAEQLATAVSRYNGGKGLAFPNSDVGTTGKDYANDTLVRMRWFAQNWGNIGK